MKETIENQQYNTRLESSDWRYSASIVGLVKYFNYCNSMGYNIDYIIGDDEIEYNSEDITEERYLLFVEYYYADDMHHKTVEQLLSNDDLTDEQIKLLNDKLVANSIMKRTFKGIRYSIEDKEKIQDKIDKNRLLLIKNTYKNGRKLYANFCNTNSLFKPKGRVCRVLNYYIDIPKKSKSISYNWNYATYEYEDEMEFDFIPFAFSRSWESFFINNNYSIKQLISTNDLIKDSDNPRSTLFKDIKNSSEFIEFDVEVIVKNRQEDYFQTLYLRKDAIEILKKINNYKGIQISYKMNSNYYINLEKEVTDSILNKIKIDNLIELLLKSDNSYYYNINVLININTLIYGGEKMDKKMKSAYSSAKRVMKSIPTNKTRSYKQKLISTIKFKDYDKFCEILLQLSSYSNVVFDFAYDLFQDFEQNKNIAYTFINALNNGYDNGGETNE